MPSPRRIAGPSLFVAALVVTLAASSAARADDLAEVRRLAAAGDRAAALQRAERALVTRPADAPLRFVRAALLAELGRADDAITAYRALTEDHPELAEPYNNLAALLATRGNVDAARSALEQAVRARPDYALAHENLGDILATLAARAYAEAARLDAENRSAPAKLQIARTLLQASAARR